MRRKYQLVVACMFLSLCFVAVAQTPATGLYQFGSFDTRGFDTINRGNLNVHFSIPIIRKTGRGGANFVYALNYDSLIWSPVTSTGAKMWTPSYEWGWTDTTNAEFGYVTYTMQMPSCVWGPHALKGFYLVEGNFQYHDREGKVHPFPMNYTSTCPNVSGPTGTGIYTTNDNSGYTIYRSNNSYIVFSKGGAESAVASYPNLDGHSAAGSGTGAGTYTDTNGNEISASASGVFTDTTGHTVLTITGTAPNPVVYAYTDSNGKSESVTVNYTTHTVATSFGVSGIGEYSQSSVPLVSSIVYPDGSQCSFTYEETPGNASATTGRIASMTLRTGGTISYAYSGGSHGIESDGTTAGLTRTTSDGNTTYTRSSVTTTSSTTQVVDGAGETGVYTFLENTAGYFYENAHSLYNAGVSGTPIEQVTTCYNENTSGCANPSVTGGFGVIYITVTRNGQMIGTDLQTYTGPELLAQDSGPTGITTNYGYQEFTGTYGIPFYRMNSQSNGQSSVTYKYDETTPTATSGLPQHVALGIPGGNLTSVHPAVSGTSTIITATMTYDNAGQLLSMKDGNGNTTTYGHDATDTFVTSVTRPVTNNVNHISSAGYDVNTGLMTSSKDENGQQTSYRYDDLLRPTEIDYPDGGKTTYNYTPTSIAQQVVENSTTNLDTTVELDGYGRTLHVTYPNGSVADTTYGGDGRVQTVSNPHFSGSSPTDGHMTYAYDVLNRITSVTNPDGSVKTASYNGLTVSLTDEAGHPRALGLDSLGNIASVTEPNASGSLAWITDYTYNPLNQITKIVQQGGNSNSALWRARTFTYDDMGRMTQQTTPESGTTNFVYDSSSNLKTKTDARGVVSSYSYDALNRVTLIAFSDGSPGRTYNYDQSSYATFTFTNPIGRLTFETNSGNSTQLFSYDQMGRINSEVVCVPSNCGIGAYTILPTYDLAGNLVSLTYPDGRHISQSYTQGQLTNINYVSWNGQAVNYGPYLSSATYGPAGNVTSEVLANGMTETMAANNRLQPTQIGVANASTTFAIWQFGWTGSGIPNNGNLLSIADAMNSAKNQSFGYDPTNRLQSASQADGSYSQTYSYDPWGNLQQAGTEIFNQTYNQNNQLAAAPFSYDAAGNLLTDGNHTYTYDPDGHILTVDTTGATYIYDASGQRVRKNVSGSWNEYIYFGGQVLAEHHADGTWTDYIYANGQKIARADTFDNYIKITGTSTAVGNYVTYTVPTPTDLNGYQIQAGDTLYVREWQSGGIEGGIGFMTTEGASTNGLIFDQNGYPGDDDPLKNQWHLRTISLTPVAGKHFAYMTFGGGSGAGQESGAYSVYFTDMVIVGANGEVHPLYTGQPSASVNYVGAANMTGLAESIGQSITNGESHFYLSDDLNSVRMVLGGWPLSESTYTPFGQEVNATISGYNNTYKFTGMEQDAETDLDHTWFRQYASVQGRWMSPDPYNGSYDIANPQSLNRYGYVNNSPTTGFDPSGLHEASCYAIIHCNPSLFWGGGVPNEGAGGGDGEFSQIYSTFYQWNGGSYYDPSTGNLQVNPSGAWLPQASFYATLTTYTMSSTGAQGIGAAPSKAPSGCMVVNGRTVCPSPIDKYNFLHPGQTNYRDSNSQCSQHTTVDNKTGQVNSHIDEFNPNYYFLNHVILDVIPDVIYDITGSYLFPTGNQFCPQ